MGEHLICDVCSATYHTDQFLEADFITRPLKKLK